MSHAIAKNSCVSSSLPTIHKEHSAQTPTISKTQSLYEYCVLTPVRALIRPLFFPLFTPLPPNNAAQMQKETQYFKDFWNPDIAPYPELSHHAKIKEQFCCKNHCFTITMNEKVYNVQCCVIESKDCAASKDCYNLVHVLGINSTIDNTIMNTYPLLGAYLDMKEPKPPGRFILFNHYSTYCADGSIYQPQTLDEAGFILSETLKSIENAYGTIHKCLAFSLGGIVAAASLKFLSPHVSVHRTALSLFQTVWHYLFHAYEYLCYPLTGRITYAEPIDPSSLKTTKVFKTLPKNICFDRCPSSIEQLSSRYTGGFLLVPLAKLSGWDIDIGKEISDFIQSHGEAAPTITVVSALQDHRFYGDANLCNSPFIQRLQKIGKVVSLLLDICIQSIHEHAQHNFSLGHWFGSHVVEEYKNQNFLQKNENLSTAIIRNSLPVQS